jgi:hypothetical protein
MDGDVEKENSNKDITPDGRSVKVEAARHTNEDNRRDNGIRKKWWIR